MRFFYWLMFLFFNYFPFEGEWCVFYHIFVYITCVCVCVCMCLNIYVYLYHICVFIVGLYGGGFSRWRSQIPAGFFCDCVEQSKFNQGKTGVKMTEKTKTTNEKKVGFFYEIDIFFWIIYLPPLLWTKYIVLFFLNLFHCIVCIYVYCCVCGVGKTSGYL